MTDDVFIFAESGVGRIRLNRPKVLHALNIDMVEAIDSALGEWKADESIRLVTIDHADGRGFCAGGDVVTLAHSGAGDTTLAARFFRSEYRMNHTLFTYPKPTIAFMDGVVMGGGVGLSQPCRWRIATERTRFAMPEGTIGLFPDVGGGWYLSRLPGETGKYLALSAAHIDGADCHALGLATHFIPSGQLETVKTRLAMDPARAEELLVEAHVAPPPSRLMDRKNDIDRLFAGETLEEIIAALAADESIWAREQHVNLLCKSPLTGKVALRLLREGTAMRDFADEMRQEYAVACRMVRLPDFHEGVRAMLIDKDNAPRWNPEKPEKVTQVMLDAIFAPLPPDQQWSPS